MKTMRQKREESAVKARRAIQQARFGLDHEAKDSAKALGWAHNAETEARTFRRAVEAELREREVI